MNVKISPSPLSGEITLPSSKSVAHRALIAAAFADKPCFLKGRFVGDDVERTADCLSRLGARIEKAEGGYRVTPAAVYAESASLYVGASGSTLRFMLPVCAALGTETSFNGTERLSARPIGDLVDELKKHGAKTDKSTLPLTLSGKVCGGRYKIDASVSSQFITGLMLALPLVGGGEIEPVGNVVSRNYLDITAAVMRAFGVNAEMTDGLIRISGKYRSPDVFNVESDWSSAAFFAVAGALGDGVSLLGLNPNSEQGDKAIIDCLRAVGADVTESGGRYIIRKNNLTPFEFDVENCPDAAPALCALASFCEGKSTLTGTGRLKIKESDRAYETVRLLGLFGITAADRGNSIEVYGGRHSGAEVTLPDDHRIAMSAAILAAFSEGDSSLIGAECVNKSYPIFFDDFIALGGKADVLTVQ